MISSSNREQVQVAYATRADFLRKMSQLREAFAAAESDVSSREHALQQAFVELSRQVQHGSAATNSADQSVAAAAAEMERQISDQVTRWQRAVENHERNTSFRSRCGDSLLVYVFGKVKSGKSSLGNYVAYGRSSPDRGDVNRSDAPSFFVEVEASGDAVTAKRTMADARAFGIDVLESTASIQGFQLAGLTWVDSPGVHSVTARNEDLARDYIESADLVIYTMSAGQPARQSDMLELKAIASAGKPCLIVITRADEAEDDETENGEIVARRVMMSPKDRTDELSWVSQQARAAGVNASIILLSVAYAEEHEDDAAELQRSGITTLFDELIRYAGSAGLEAKRKAPLKNLVSFADRIVSADSNDPLSVAVILGTLARTAERLQQRRAQFRQVLERALVRVNMELARLIPLEVERYAAKRDNEGLDVAITESLKLAFTSHLYPEVDLLLKDTFAEFVPGTMDIPGLESFKFSDITVEREFDTTEFRGRVGMAIGAGACSILLPIGLSVLGPPGWIAAAALGLAGAAVGGGVGSAVGSSFGSKTTEKIIVGDNRKEVSERRVIEAQKVALADVGRFSESLETKLIKPVEARVRHLSDALDGFVQQVNHRVLQR